MRAEKGLNPRYVREAQGFLQALQCRRLTAASLCGLLSPCEPPPLCRHSRKTLKVLGTVGEPINPEAWLWYYRVVGEERCPIVDTFWQTETVSPHLGVSGTSLSLVLPAGSRVSRQVCCDISVLLWGLVVLLAQELTPIVAGVACKCWFPFSLRASESPWGDLKRFPAKVCSELCSLCFLQHLQSFMPKHGLPVPCCILPSRLASPRLIPFCLPLQGGHMLTSLPAATPMKPGSAVSTSLPPRREGSPLPLVSTLQCLGSPPCLLAVWSPWQTFPFFGVVPAIVNESGEELEGEAEGYLVKRG